MNILIIGGSGNEPSANSICVRNMALEFLYRGDKVWILASGDECVKESKEIGGAILWQVPETWYSSFTKRVFHNPSVLKLLCFKIVSALRHLLLLFTYPMTEPIRSRKVLKKAKVLVKDNDIKLVLAIHNNYANIYSGIELKKIYGDRIKVVSYHLDLRTASINTFVPVREYVYHHALSSIAEESKIVDKILIPYSGQAEVESIIGLELRKFCFVGFPVYIEDGKTEPCKLPFKEGFVNICYIGTLSRDNRNPRYVLSLLEQAEEQMGQKLMVHFWGNVGEVEKILEESPVAIYHGMVENGYVQYIQDNSDFLLNIGNAIAYSMLPSKVFGLFSTGKPIINVINHPKDATFPFFKRYNHSIDIKEYSPSPEDVNNIVEGIKKMMITPRKVVNGLFDDFKPETICDEILE